MATFANNNYSGSNYADFRPTYPSSFFEHLSKWAPEGGVCVDVGCGPGSATHELAKTVAKEAVGIDPSKTMIDTAEKLYAGVKNLSFKQGGDKELTSLFAESSIDLVTVAEAAHWFEYPAFFESVHKILKPNGKLAIWGYVDPHIEGFPEFRKKLIEVSYGPDGFGPYWDPGRQLLTDLYHNLPIPDTFKVDLFDPVPGDAKDYTDKLLQIQRTLTIRQFLSYLATYSSYHNWKTANPDKKDKVEEFGEYLATIGLPLDKEVTMRWDTTLILAQKK